MHTSRVKVDQHLEVQIQQGTLIDLGKVVHYHFDKATHLQKPEQKVTQGYQIFRQAHPYMIDPDQEPRLRARPTWVSVDENKDMI